MGRFWAGWLFDLSLRNTSGGGETLNAGYFSRHLDEDFRPRSYHWIGPEKWNREKVRQTEAIYGEGGMRLHSVFMNAFRVMTVNFDPTAHDNAARDGDEFKGITRWEKDEFYRSFPLSGYGNDWKLRPIDQERWKLYELMLENFYRATMLFEIDIAERTGEPIEPFGRFEIFKDFFANNSSSPYHAENMGLYQKWESLLRSE